jgi:hypothetical protein
MRSQSDVEKENLIWGCYANYDDIARFEYGRRMWRLPQMRQSLLSHWADPRHPYRDRFRAQRELIEEVLSSSASVEALDSALRQREASLRSVIREIPPVFGSFWNTPPPIV